MKSIKIKDILTATDGKLISGNENTVITDVSTDSRKINAGSLFIPLSGEKFDGHDYIADVFKKNAAASLTSLEKEQIKGEIPENAVLIKVENTLNALGSIAGFYRSLFDISAVAITGSVGKTTTKEMTYCVLSKKYNVLKNKGNFNNEIGVPLTLFGLGDSYEILLSEMGMSGFGEIDRLSKMVKPEIVIMTNIGMSHIELLGSRENIYKAKSEFLNNMSPDGSVIINGDDDMLMKHKNEMGKKIVTVGIENKNSDIVAENIKSTADKISFDVCGIGEKFTAELFVPGEHNVYNALFACACGMVCGITADEIKDALAHFISPDMRLATLHTPNYTIINDCYNAAPDSVVAALKVLSVNEGRKVAILGDIDCLGEYSYEAHKGVGADVCKYKTDILVTVGKKARTIAESASENGMGNNSIYSFDDCEDAIASLGNILKKGDAVLVKASRIMQLEKITNHLTKN